MSVVTLQPYPVLVPGYEHLSPAEAAERLHHKKNSTDWPPRDVVEAHQDERARLIAGMSAEDRERFAQYPKAMYRPWEESRKKLASARAANRLQIQQPIVNALDQEAIERFIGEYESALANSQAEEDTLKGQGWVFTPDEAKKRAFADHREFATDALLSMHDDRHMSEKSREYRNAVEDAAEDHVTEIPATPIPTHHKKK